LEDELAVHGVLVDAQGRRWSDPEVVYDFRKVDSGPDTCLTKLDVAPTGNWLAVGITHFEGARTWLLNLASQEPRFVSACEGYFSCTVRDWSPDGTAIILARNRGDFNPSDFVIVDVASDATTVLHVPDTRLDHPYVKEVAFSPDGRFIAWTIEGYEQSETTQVWLTGGKGEQAQLLTSEVGQIWSLAWHPDGSQVAYSFAVGEQRPSVWLLSVDGRQSVPLVPSPDSFSNPVWSPDGLQVAMTQCVDVPDEATLADQKCNISVLDRRSGLISPAVVHPGRVYWDISWSPDAKLLAFLSASDKELQVVWLFSSETGKSYPVSGYLRPFSEYAWLPFSFAGER
jgi:WD40 repeat protein